MSSMMEQVPMDQGSQTGVAQFSQSAPRHKIKRPGQAPLVFEGTELAMAMSFTPSLPYWYEMNIYRVSDHRYVACVRLFYGSPSEENTMRGWDCDSLEEAIDTLTTYDAADDILLSMDGADSERSAAELAAYASELRARIKSQRQHYQSLVGEFLHSLEGGD